jgi:hypothetical protein
MPDLAHINCSDSSALQTLIFNRSDATLYAKYRSVDRDGKHFVYKYRNVPSHLLNQLQDSSQSQGRTMSTIRNTCKMEKLVDFPFSVTNTSHENPKRWNSSTKKKKASTKARANYTTQWLSSILAAKHDLAWLEEHLNKISKMMNRYAKSYPSKLPPSKPDTTARDDLAMDDITSAVANLSTHPTAEPGKHSSVNRFAGLDADDDDEEEEDSDDESTEDAATNPATANPAGKQSTTQNRYIQFRVIIAIVECLIHQANKQKNAKHWDQCAEYWNQAYLRINVLNIEYKPWDIMLEEEGRHQLINQASLPDDHNRKQLLELINSLDILYDFTDTNLQRSIDDLTREQAKIEHALAPMYMDRDAVKRRYGDRWKNNPHPKKDFAARREELENQIRALIAALDVMYRLHIENHLRR